MSQAADARAAEQFGLAEPVRQRLVQVAGEVLARLPAEQVPASLRAIARFTPGKRQRLGAVAIAAALDTDDTFRQAVADAVADASGNVVTGVLEGVALHVTDPVDAAAVAYLARPDGWQQAVSDAVARWRAENAPRAAANEEAARLRAELADVRAQLKSALSRAKTAEASLAGERAPVPDADEVARLTKALRTRTGELRAAERARDSALEELAAARAESVTLTESHAEQLRELTARIEQLQRGVETGRRSARVERDLDDARLRMLVETLTEAAAGIRRELALPASASRPADSVDSLGVATGDTRGADDAAGLERLLGLPRVHLIVDGYNVTKTGYGDLPLVDQRSRLLSGVAAWCARTGIEATVVFDGGPRPAAPVRAPRGVRVMFSAEDEIADDLIRRLVSAEPTGRPVVVVTSDEAVVTDVRGNGGLHRAGKRVGGPTAVICAEPSEIVGGGFYGGGRSVEEVAMLIDCDTCVIRGKGCPDCVISVLLGMPGPVELDDAEQTAIGALADAGLVPPLRLVPRYREHNAKPA